MDRRAFLRATGTAAATSAALVAPESANAEGYRRCEQLHEKLTETDLDRWVTPLPFPLEVFPKVITKDSVQDPRLGGGSQGIAPEFYWSFADYAAPLPDGNIWAIAKPGVERADDIFRAEVNGAPAPLQYAELATRAIVKEVIPGWFSRILCYGYKERNEQGEVTAEHFDTPGPTIHAQAGHPLVVRLRNEIDPGLLLDVSLHQHGGHVPAHSDGHPGFLIEPQSYKGSPHTHEAGIRDYYYPNPVPKIVKQSANGSGCWSWEKQNEWDFPEIQNTMWYHDHAEDITAHNALMGLAGYFFLDDSTLFEPNADPTGEPGWRNFLPKKQIPLVFKDLCFCPITADDQIQPAVKDAIADHHKKHPGQRIFGEARIHFDPFDHNGTLGNIQVVNGAAYPQQEVNFHRYWLRMLDASLARFYNIEFWVTNPKTKERKRLVFHRFGKDSWLFDKAIEQSSVFLGMATRADVCLNFDQLNSDVFKDFAHNDGHFEVMVVSTLNQRDGRGPGHGDNEQTLADNPRGTADEIREERDAPLYLMKFIVKADAADRLTWPKASRDANKDPYEDDTTSKPMTAGSPLRHHHVMPVPERKDIFVREFNFERGRGAWQINKRFFDSCIANAANQLWSTELWILRNRSGGWWHPIHIHLESHQQLFVRARNHRGQRISLCRHGYDPKAFEPGLEMDEGETLLDPSFIRWYLTFPQFIPTDINEREELLTKLKAWDQSQLSPEEKQQLARLIEGTWDSSVRHNAAALDFDASVWNLGIKHDTTILGPNTEVHILMQFRTFEGPFVFHCHNLDHEDMRMMFQMDPRADLTCPDEQLKVRPEYWYFKNPTHAEPCCEKTKGDHA
jgi:FtsP/CotA-like multicopper oxidase with cupredoxin domain